MSSDGAAFRVRDLHKHYLVFDKPADRLKQGVVPRVQNILGRPPSRYFRDFAALGGVTFDVMRGEAVGILGRNGSGKSTLLQIVCGTLQPTRGTVEVRGRVGAILELGAGFSPEFTGRENVYVNSAVMGLTRVEIDGRFDAIADFADIGAYMEMPVKTYSSGMFMRLAFAVAVCVDPDILVVDEALAVGDVKFQAKCFRRFDELLSRGATILFVTHATEQVVRHCNRAMLLEGGRLVATGEPRTIANRYYDLLFGAGEDVPSKAEREGAAVGEVAPTRPNGRLEDRARYNRSEYRWGSGEAQILDAIVTSEGVDCPVWRAGTPLEVTLRVRFLRAVERPIFGLTITTPDGVAVYTSNSRDFAKGPVWHAAAAEETRLLRFRLANHLCPGDYLVSLGIAEQVSSEVRPLDRRYDVLTLRVEGASRAGGLADLELDFTEL
jgi:lipopolysaccharide transport system ATP-binding protein